MFVMLRGEPYCGDAPSISMALHWMNASCHGVLLTIPPKIRPPRSENQTAQAFLRFTTAKVTTPSGAPHRGGTHHWATLGWSGYLKAFPTHGH